MTAVDVSFSRLRAAGLLIVNQGPHSINSVDNTLIHCQNRCNSILLRNKEKEATIISYVYRGISVLFQVFCPISERRKKVFDQQMHIYSTHSDMHMKLKRIDAILDGMKKRHF